MKRAQGCFLRIFFTAVLVLRGEAQLATGNEKRHPLIPKVLTTSSSKPAGVPTFSWFGESICTQDGSTFFHADTGKYNDSVILRLSPDGSRYTLYALPAEVAKDTAFGSFSVMPTGGVWLLTETREGDIKAFGFDSDGQLSTQTRMEVSSHFRPKEFAVFESGAMLVGGYFGSLAAPALRGKRYFALFEPSGKLRQKLDEAFSDVDLGKVATTLHEGGVTVGPDGNLYILAPDQVIVVAESGSIVRRVPFRKPDPAATATKILVSENLIAIWLFTLGKDESAAPQYLVLNYENGEPVGLYAPAEQLGNNAVCFSRQEGWTFLQAEDGRIRLATAPLN